MEIYKEDNRNDCASVNSSNCQELVIFSYSSPFHEKLQSNERLFTLFGQLLRLQQRWKEGGKGGTDIGFGASVYDCSFVLAHYLEMNPTIAHNKVVVELGCGPGLASFGSILAGAKYTIATDGDPLSTQLAGLNFTNNLSSEQLRLTSIKKLFWGNGDDMSSLREDVIRSSGEASLGKVDVIIAADVAALPYADSYPALVNTLLELLHADGVAYICYQRRHVSEDDFFDLLRQSFHVERLSRSTIHADFKQRPISLFRCTPNLSSPSTSTL